MISNQLKSPKFKFVHDFYLNVTTLRLANGMANPSVCRLTCVHPTQGV